MIMKRKRHWVIRGGIAIVLLTCLLGYLLNDWIMMPSVARADRMEQQNALPLTVFYDQPADWSQTTPGDLLKMEEASGYALPDGVKAVRILYHSLDSAGQDVVSSAVVLTPAGSPPLGGWKVIVWAHGTSGVARQCAPSAMKDVYYGEEGLFPMLRAGYAVVAIDYHGLGTHGLHQYLSKIGQAWDVINSIPAARAAVPDLGKRWVVDGHSQGGLAAWGVAELEVGRKDPDYLGAVAVSAPTDLGHIFETPEATRGAGFYVAWLAYGIHARYPQFQPQEILTSEAMKLYDSATAGGCWYHGYATYAGAEAASVMMPHVAHNTWVEMFLNENAVGKNPVYGPMFVIGGEADQTVPIENMRKTFKLLCSQTANVRFRSYPGLDHDPTMTNSTPDQLVWINDRFSNKPADGNCDAAY